MGPQIASDGGGLPMKWSEGWDVSPYPSSVTRELEIEFYKNSFLKLIFILFYLYI